METYKYNQEADTELERFYQSVGAVSDFQKINAFELLLGQSNFHVGWGVPEEKARAMKVACLEQEYLESKGLIEVHFS